MAGVRQPDIGGGAPGLHGGQVVAHGAVLHGGHQVHRGEGVRGAGSGQVAHLQVVWCGHVLWYGVVCHLHHVQGAGQQEEVPRHGGAAGRPAGRHVLGTTLNQQPQSSAGLKPDRIAGSGLKPANAPAVGGHLGGEVVGGDDPHHGHQRATPRLPSHSSGRGGFRDISKSLHDPVHQFLKP